jgi:hypothetical protein
MEAKFIMDCSAYILLLLLINKKARALAAPVKFLLRATRIII